VHPIVKYSIGTAGSGMYCLRLPDPSLYDFMKGRIPQLAALGDQTTIYTSWEDLCMTLQNIVRMEADASGTRIPWINAPYYKSNLFTNPRDHEDHTATGLAVKRFASSLGNRAWWWGYDISRHPDWGLDGSDLSNKYALFNAYKNAVLNLLERNGNPPCSSQNARSMDTEWSSWGPRSHSKLVIYPGSDGD
jgi:hypothetical protein